MIESDPARTAERIWKLEEYVRLNLLCNERFICEHHRACRASVSSFSFFEGQMSHVGKHYDLLVDGRELRVVVVGQEYGQPLTRIDLQGRTAMIDGAADRGFRGRNKHMRGTTSILRLLLGRPLGTGHKGERLFAGDQRTAHVFDGFALVNALLCSAVEGRKTKGESSPLMRTNCARHFRLTMEILEPTVIVVEGQRVRDWIGGSLGLGSKPDSVYYGPATSEIGRVAGGRVDVLTFNHPSAGNPSNWWGNSIESAYLREVVEPTIARWRDHRAREPKQPLRHDNH